MTDAPHTVMASSTPYVWSLILSFGTLLISIILIDIARFQAKLEIKDLAALRTMFDRYPAWGETCHSPDQWLGCSACFAVEFFTSPD